MSVCSVSKQVFVELVYVVCIQTHWCTHWKTQLTCLPPIVFFSHIILKFQKKGVPHFSHCAPSPHSAVYKQRKHPSHKCGILLTHNIYHELILKTKIHTNSTTMYHRLLSYTWLDSSTTTFKYTQVILKLC